MWRTTGLWAPYSQSQGQKAWNTILPELELNKEARSSSSRPYSLNTSPRMPLWEPRTHPWSRAQSHIPKVWGCRIRLRKTDQEGFSLQVPISPPVVSKPPNRRFLIFISPSVQTTRPFQLLSYLSFIYLCNGIGCIILFLHRYIFETFLYETIEEKSSYNKGNVICSQSFERRLWIQWHVWQANIETVLFRTVTFYALIILISTYSNFLNLYRSDTKWSRWLSFRLPCV